MRFHLMLFICLSFCSVFSKIIVADHTEKDQCSLRTCKENEICVVENNDTTCRVIETKNFCQSSPCENGGSCIISSDLPQGFFCNCPDGFGGDKCEIGCKLLCKNGGSCIITSDSTQVCKCPSRYSGENCEIDQCSLRTCKENEICVVENNDTTCRVIETKNFCQSSPCENGGSCIISSDLPEGFFCNCPDGFGGDKCEIDQCSLRTCNENEICVVENNDTTCRVIETKDLCQPNPCENGGSCIISSNLPEVFYCKCPKGFAGEKCEIDQCSLSCNEDQICVFENEDIKCKEKEDVVEEGPCESNPCKNGGYCSVGNNTLEGFSCICQLPYEGKKCEIGESDDTSDDPVTMTPIKKSSTPIIKTNQVNTDDHHKNFTQTTHDPSTRRTSAVHNNTTKTFYTSPRTTAASTTVVEISSDETQQTDYVTTIDNFTTAKHTSNNTFSGGTDQTFSTSSSNTVSNTPDLKTSTDKSQQPISRTVTGDLTTDEYTTDTNGLLQSSQSSSQISVKSTQSISTPENTPSTVPEITSEKPQTEIVRSTKYKEKTEIIDVKSTVFDTVSFGTTTENSNFTSDESVINKANASSQSISTYISIGVACFAAVVAFIVGGWYLRRIRRVRYPHIYYRDYDTASEDSNHSHA